MGLEEGIIYSGNIKYWEYGDYIGFEYCVVRDIVGFNFIIN